MSEVVVICTDKNYVNHVKYNINNIRDKHGDIDICIIYEDIESESVYIKQELSKYNVILKPITKLMDTKGPYGLTYHTFDTFFKKWDKILYIDCDTVIFSSLNPLFNQLNDETKMMVDYEGISIKEFFTMWTPLTNENHEKFEELNYEKLIDVNSKGFNCGIFSFKSSIINEDTVRKLYEIHEKYLSINNHGQNGKASDQPIINILFGNISKQVKDNGFCFWKSINDNTVIGHFCRWDAPWNNVMFNKKINSSYLDYYNKCLLF
jgi:lipopolysaccharide biosynthesis glycosyltransferase